ncbi:MAG: SAM-dependent methyltransferase, partial [Planctomycetota bacterium]
MGVEPISPDSSGDSSSGEWFGAWFDSPYYHRLYRDRDLSEARDLLDRLVRWLRLAPGAKVLD